MKTLSFADAIEDAIAQAMSEDSKVIIMGEDVRLLRVNLFSRFGQKRVINTPISESAFLGAGVSAAMAGLRPIVEIMLVDFIGVPMDALLNHAAKTEFFSGNNWKVPLVVRVSCGGGYGDGGQHEQTLWGWLAHIPGLTVVVPSNPADAGGLMLASIHHDGPVVYFEHKLLADYWRDYLGSGGRNLDYNVPENGANGPVPDKWSPIPFGIASIRKYGKDLTMVSLGVGVHRAMEAAELLETKGVSAEVLDLRTVSPLDSSAIGSSVAKTGRLLVIDEDYKQFGLSGEIAALVLENSIQFKFGRVCTESTIPYSHAFENQVIPGAQKIAEVALTLLK
ncbi:MAG: transketolase C-terminal domain-containing protein [Bacteroidales bacterium]|jgi:pyruvate dehydrogenase E1 component beta subunit